jgi:hypothetical protein
MSSGCRHLRRVIQRLLKADHCPRRRMSMLADHIVCGVLVQIGSANRLELLEQN